MKLALLLNVVEPRIGGVLIMGDRGTGKSVAVRALVELLPQIDVVKGDPYNSDPDNVSNMGPEARAAAREGKELARGKARIPMVEVPLGATEDRVCGTIDIEKALSEGIRAYEPGLLAKANRGILYIDEVNLLDDSLVDVVLDSAAGGWNTVEREGVSVTHPAKFIMIGSGNPEEGEMRPQLLDRFGMAVTVQTLNSVEERTSLVMNRMRYEEDTEGYLKEVDETQTRLREKLAAARTTLPKVTIDKKLSLKISEICSLLDVDGLRGDIVVTRAAKALAAFEGRTEATQEDIRQIVGPCLAHRLRKDPMAAIDSGYKVALAYKRIFLNEVVAEPEPEPEPEAAPKKAGSWGGL